MNEFHCPGCMSEGPFKIESATLATWSSAEDVDAGDLEWSQDSYMECVSCGHDGIVENFEQPSELRHTGKHEVLAEAEAGACRECGSAIALTDMRAGCGMCGSCLHDALRSGWEPGGSDD